MILYERFINQDTYKGTLRNPQSQNLYTYVHNNPLKYTDPTGHFAFLLPLAFPGRWAAIGAGLTAVGAEIATGIAIDKAKEKGKKKKR